MGIIGGVACSIRLILPLLALVGCRSPEPHEPAGTQSVRFAVIGDFGSGNAAEDRVARMLRDHTSRHPIDALVTTGDNIYPSGQPSGLQRRWREPYGWVAARGLEVIASLGNHDIVTDQGRPVMDLLSMPARWYARRIGPVEVFALDSNHARNPRQAAWLRDALKASTARWQVVVFHHPPFSCGPHGNDDDVREVLLPILTSGGADLVLNGHDHAYERFAPRRDVTFIVTAGGGAGLYGLGSCRSTPRLVEGRAVHHALIVAATDVRLRVRALSPRGDAFDEVVLGQPGNAS